MFRTFFYLLVTIFLLTIVRSVVGMIMRGFSDLVSPGQQRAGTGSGQQPPPAAGGSAGGELKRDPVCGTYVPASTAFQKTVGGQVLHFCSVDCRDRYKASA